MSRKDKGLIEMLIATFIWGSTPLASIFSNLPSGVFVFFRVVFAFPFILYLLSKKEGLSTFFAIKPFEYLFLSGFFLALNWILFFWAIDIAGVNLAVIIYYGGPIFTIVLATIFLKEPFNIKILLSIVLVATGVLLSVGGVDGFNYGSIIALFAAISYGFLGFFSKLATTKHSSYKVTAWQILIAIIFTLPFAVIQEYSLNSTTIIIVIITGVIHTALALFLWYDSLKYIAVSIASILAYLDIFFAMILSWIFLSQIPTTNEIIGSLLIVLAGVIATLL